MKKRYSYKPSTKQPNVRFNETLHRLAEELHLRAEATLKFFLEADNCNNGEVVDLDPRLGYVRLGDTSAQNLLEDGFPRVMGLMNNKRELQAVSTKGGKASILTISDSGRHISHIRPHSTIETLVYEPDGTRTFVLKSA